MVHSVYVMAATRPCVGQLPDLKRSRPVSHRRKNRARINGADSPDVSTYVDWMPATTSISREKESSLLGSEKARVCRNELQLLGGSWLLQARPVNVALSFQLHTPAQRNGRGRFANYIWRGLRHSGSKRCGLPTAMTAARAREVTNLAADPAI